MTAEIGLFFLVVALLCASLQAFYLVASSSLKTPLAACLQPAAWLQAFCISMALAVLMTLRLDSDFSVLNVVQHSNLHLPVLYKIAGTWGNHEGSMLLWVWVLAIFGAILARPTTNHQPLTINLAIATQATIGVGMLLFVLFTSNPFARRFPPTVDGEALNPLLQDMALSMHPPFLYLGYVGFSLVFSLAVAGLLQGRMGREWAVLAHPWILAAWSALTFGIGLGSWWAYRVLGWGGFWFWDPVENASLLPWLSGTALLHANIVLKKRGALAQWVALLSIITFGLSLLGTFLVRSGVLISVHSFASDPARGAVILLLTGLMLGGALALYAVRGGRIAGSDPLHPVSREGMIVLNNLLLLTACATVFLGTVYPMLSEWLGDGKLTVGPPYFNATFLPLMAIPLALAGLVPFMPWQRAHWRSALRRATPALCAAAAGGLLVLACVRRDAALAAAGMMLAIWLGISSLQWLLAHRHARGNMGLFLAHVGAAVVVAGITGASLWKTENEGWMAPGDRITVGGTTLTLDGMKTLPTPNHTALQATLVLEDGTSLTPEYRTYAIRGSATSIASIRRYLTHDLYAVVGEPSPDGKRVSVRVYDNPMIGFIWAGCVLMSVAGVTAIVSRRRHGS